MQLTIALIVTSFLAFTTSVHSVNITFYEKPSPHCPKANDNFAKNVRCNMCVQASSTYKTVHGTKLGPGESLELFTGTWCTGSSIMSAQENKGKLCTTVVGDTVIRSVYVHCSANHESDHSEDSSESSDM